MNSDAESRFDSDGLTVIDLIQFVRGNFWTVGIVATAVFGLAVAYAILKVPEYRITALLEPVSLESERQSLSARAGALSSLANFNLFGDDTTSVERSIATLQSHDFLASYISDKQLLPVLFPDEWNDATGKWKDMSLDDIPTTWDGVKYFKEEVLSVDKDDRTGLVTISVEWSDPEQAVGWVSDLVRRLNSRLRQQALVEAENGMEALRQELASTDNPYLTQLIVTMMESRIDALTTARVRQDYAFKIIDPPVVPPADEFVRPNRVLVLILGLFAGLLLGLLAALGRNILKQARSATT